MPAAAPAPADLQKRLGNRGTLAFAEQSFGKVDEKTDAEPAQKDVAQQEPLEPDTAALAPTPAKDDTADSAVAEPGVDANQEPAQKDAAQDGQKPEPAMADGAADDGAAAGAEPPAEEPAATTVKVVADSPAGVMNQLVGAPPTQSVLAYSQAGEASATVLGKQTAQAQSEMPEVPAPTGISSKSLGDVVKEQLEKGARPPQKLEGEQQGRETQVYPTDVDAGPPAPPPTPTVLAGGEESNADGGDREMSISAQRALDNIRIFTGEIPDGAGPRPGVDMTGEANPSQMSDFRSSSDSTVTDAAGVARKDTYKDFGENDIFPPESDEILRSERQFATRGPSAEGMESPALPADIAGALDQSTGAVYREKVGAQRDEYLVGEADYERDKQAAHEGAKRDMADAELATKKEQMQKREGAQLLVAGYRKEWREEIDAIDADYRGKADKARDKYRGDIDKKRKEGESKAETHLVEAEKKAAQKKRKAEEDVRREKAKKRKKSGGFWGWAKRAASALVDAVKKAVNFIFDQLRKVVKGIFELAKKLARAAIELARRAIVGLIKAFGAVLKGFVSIALAAFPDKAEKINAKIDGAVDTAVEAVDAAAKALTKAVDAILDFLASTIDSLLGLIQKIYNGIFTVIGMIIRGEFGELFRRLGNLVKAARMAPSRFETAAYEELLGGNLDEPLSPVELAQAGITPPGGDMGSPAPGQEPKPTWSKQNVGVDAVATDMQLSPELTSQLLSTMSGDGVMEFGESADKQRSMESIMQEAGGAQSKDAAATGGKQTKNPPDGLTPTQRAQAKWKIMKQGLSKWWQDNKVTIIAGTVAAIVGVIAAIIISGGAILGAIPPIMSVLGPIFIGASIAAIATRVGDYVSQSWEGNIKEGAKSLAKALAAGAIEIISLITFKVGGAALKGSKALVKSGAKAFQKARSGLSKMASSTGKAMISRGKVLFKGIANSGIGKRAKNLRELGERLLARTRFRKFRIVRTGYRFRIEGFVNPWILLASGRLEKIDQSELRKLTKDGRLAKKGKTARLGDKVQLADGKRGIVVGVKSKKIPRSGGKTVEVPEGKFAKGLRDLQSKRGLRNTTKVKKLRNEYNKLTRMDPDLRLKKLRGKSAKSTRELRKTIGFKPKHFEAHHLVPEELMKVKEIKKFLDDLNFNFQSGKHNGVMLPPDEATLLALKKSNPSRYPKWKSATKHKGSHSGYTRRVEKRLQKLIENFKKEAAAVGDTPQLRAAYRDKVDTYVKGLRSRLLSGELKLN